MDNERKAALQDKRLRLSHAGNLVEAALDIHDCFCSAQKAAAHNYPSHFGRLSELQSGDVVVFTDVTGTTHRYEVVLLETLPAAATQEMITAGFDLSLYTCTTGGGSRVTVRCNAV